MTTSDGILIGLALLAVVTIVGIFKTKTPGFGRYSTSVLLLSLVLFVSAILLVADKIDASVFINIAFAVTGFAGGVVTAKEP